MNHRNWQPTTYPSRLQLSNGKLKLHLFQSACGKQLIGDRHALERALIHSEPTQVEVDHCCELLKHTSPDSLTVISYHPGFRGCTSELKHYSESRTIVGLSGSSGNGTNLVYIATGGQLLKKAKLSLSSEDLAMDFKSGTELPLFSSDDQGLDAPVRWLVLNCHDYTHVDLIRAIQASRAELIVLVTYNTATRLFWEYALSDTHRLFCYIVVVNVAELGGSAVYAPFRKLGGQEHASLNLSGQLFGARGPGTLNLTTTLDICELRKLRIEYSQNGFGFGKARNGEPSLYQSISPPEHYLASHDRPAGPPAVDGIYEHRVDFNFESPRVAIAQLDSMSLQAYIQTKYRIRNHPDSIQFEHSLNNRLLELETRCRNLPQKTESLLDLLVLPEVFVPRSFTRTLQGFSDRLGCLVIAGVDYPGHDESENANECVILRPRQESLTYRKISRSQYDAVGDKRRMPMLRGKHLVRLLGSGDRGIGVLICSDYSHFDLMWALNLQDRSTPLDAVIVVAHNPFASLYRSCAVADSHRFYQYILISNVSAYGGSGVFGPQRTKGSRQTLAEVGQGVETIALATLPLSQLQASRLNDDTALHDGEFMRRPGVFQSRWLPSPPEDTAGKIH